MGKPTAPRNRQARFAIVFFLCLTGLGYFLVQHYRFGRPLIQITPRGLTALAAYELGAYARAAKLWRATHGLAYDPAAVPRLLEAANAEIGEHPDDLVGYLRVADLAMACGDYGRAAQAYEQALQRDPELADAAIGLASVRLLQGAYPEARQLLDPVFDRAVVERYLPTFLNFLVALDALVHGPGPLDAERDLALAYAYRYLAIFDPRQYSTVIRYAARSLQRDPGRDAAYFCAGVAYLKQGQLDAAIQQFEFAVQINPRNAEAYHRLAYLHGERGRPDQELRYYRRAVEAAPETPRYVYGLGLVLRDKFGDLPQAVAALGRAHALQPDRYGYTLSLADALEQLHEYEEALALFEGLARTHPESAEVAYFHAKCLVSIHRYTDAVAILERARAVRPLPPWVMRELAFAYGQLNRHDAALAAAEEVVRRVPHDVGTLYNLQGSYRRVGRYADAYRVVQQILTLQPNHAGALRVLPYLERNLQR
jgi:tetratricopeptide (TPR) repeat protein